MNNLQPRLIAIELLHDNPYQPRSAMDEESLQQLADTIKAQGFQGVLVARPHPQLARAFQLTAGHRRREAARLAGLSILPVLVESHSDQEMMALALTENIQREDLTPLEEGKLFQRMIVDMGLTQTEVAAAIKKTRKYVRNRLQLVQAPLDIQEFASTKAGTLEAVGYLLKIDDPAERATIIQRLMDGTLMTEDLLKRPETNLEQNVVLPQVLEQPPQQDASGASAPVVTQATITPTPDKVSVNEKPVPAKGNANKKPVPEPQTHVSAQVVAKPVPQPAQTTNSVESAPDPVQAQVDKLKLGCEYVADFVHRVYESHVPVKDADISLLIQQANMLQQFLRLYA